MGTAWYGSIVLRFKLEAYFAIRLVDTRIHTKGMKDYRFESNQACFEDIQLFACKKNEKNKFLSLGLRDSNYCRVRKLFPEAT